MKFFTLEKYIWDLHGGSIEIWGHVWTVEPVCLVLNPLPFMSHVSWANYLTFLCLPCLIFKMGWKHLHHRVVAGLKGFKHSSAGCFMDTAARQEAVRGRSTRQSSCLQLRQPGGEHNFFKLSSLYHQERSSFLISPKVWIVLAVRPCTLNYW